MIHIAIMSRHRQVAALGSSIKSGKKDWIGMILSGEKTIESRWYKTKREPWSLIKKGETIYFKNSGEPVSLRAVVEKTVQFDNLDEDKVKEILDEYGRDIGVNKEDDKFLENFRNKKYCILIFLKNPRAIKPFEINKKGFGSMTS